MKKPSCIGCGSEPSQEEWENIQADCLKSGGDPGTITIRCCDSCPPGAVAQFEYDRLNAEPDEGFADYHYGD